LPLLLDPDSRAELGALGDEHLVQIIDRILDDPSGRRQPLHNYTRLFRNPRRYVRVARDERVWELRTSSWRGLFVLIGLPEGRGIFFIPVRDKRFWTMSECPWH
jgi:hypothetical protein